MARAAFTMRAVDNSPTKKHEIAVGSAAHETRLTHGWLAGDL